MRSWKSFIVPPYVIGRGARVRHSGGRPQVEALVHIQVEGAAEVDVGPEQRDQAASAHRGAGPSSSKNFSNRLKPSRVVPLCGPPRERDGALGHEHVWRVAARELELYDTGDVDGADEVFAPE